VTPSLCQQRFLIFHQESNVRQQLLSLRDGLAMSKDAIIFQ